MTVPRVPRVPPGGRVTGASFNDLADVVESRSRGAHAGGGAGGFGDAAGFADEDYFWAKVTAVGDGDPHPHSFVTVVEDRDSGEWVDDDDGLAGDWDEYPLYDANNKCLAVGTVVRAWLGTGDWVFCDHCCGVACPPKGTTTSTTMPPCSGGCRWVWVPSLKLWFNVFSTCGDCLCHTPQYCGTLDCEETHGECGRGGPPTPDCGQTTTPDPFGTTSTTTTGVPGDGSCSGGCQWRWKLNAWNWVSGNCSPGRLSTSCHCDLPQFEGSDCQFGSSPCLKEEPTTTPAPGCTGYCLWFWDPDLLKWVRLLSDSFNCVGPSGCGCEQPSRPGNPCEISTPIYCYVPGTTVGPTTPRPTTTPGPGSCTGTCKWKWNGSAWAYVSTNCGSLCSCYRSPDYAGSSTCETQVMPCEGTTTTTTTTTTTCAPTTTTAEAGCGRCSWQWSAGGFWTPMADNCLVSADGCKCNPPSASGNFACGLRVVTGCINSFGCTTTTCAPTTTTTAGPCGYCQYQTIRTYSAGCPATAWALVGTYCASPATCGSAPACIPPDVGATATVACGGCTTTTTTTAGPTTTTTCVPQSTTPPVAQCGHSGGTCDYQWNGSVWQLVNFGCTYFANENACYCGSAPTGKGCLWERISVPCLLDGATTTTTTTTLAPPSCGQCTYTYFASLGWVQTVSGCTGSCTCPSAPGSTPAPGTSQTFNCAGATTSTTPSSGTSTTASP